MKRGVVPVLRITGGRDHDQGRGTLINVIILYSNRAFTMICSFFCVGVDQEVENDIPLAEGHEAGLGHVTGGCVMGMAQYNNNRRVDTDLHIVVIVTRTDQDVKRSHPSQ